MTELERLKGNLDVLHKAYRLSGMSGKIYLLIDRERDIIRQRIADLEAQQKQVDPWERARGCVDYALKHYLHNSNGREIALYARHLEAKVAELDDELRCERIDGGKVRDDLKARIAEMEQHGRKVDQANHEHYGRLQDQIAIRDLKIEKLERQAPAERNREKLAELTTIANAIPPACGIFFYSEQFRETLELARELVEKRIEGVKKEMQGNG